MGTLAIIGSTVGASGASGGPIESSILTEPFDYQSGDADPTPLESHTHSGNVWTKEFGGGTQLEIKSADDYATPDDGAGISFFSYSIVAPSAVERISVDVKNTGTVAKSNAVACYIGWRYVVSDSLSGMMVVLSETNLDSDVTLSLYEWTSGITFLLRGSATGAGAAGALANFNNIIITEQGGQTIVDATSIHANLLITWGAISTNGDDTKVSLDNFYGAGGGALANDEHTAWENLELYNFV